MNQIYLLNYRASILILNACNINKCVRIIQRRLKEYGLHAYCNQKSFYLQKLYRKMAFLEHVS